MNRKNWLIVLAVVLIAIGVYNSQVGFGPISVDKDSGFSGVPSVGASPSFKECLTAFGCDAEGCKTERFVPPRLPVEFVRDCLDNHLESLIELLQEPLEDDDNDGTPNYEDPDDNDPCIPSEDNDACQNSDAPYNPELCESMMYNILLDWGCVVSENNECYGDYNGDGVVNIWDLLDLLRDWPNCELHG